MDFMVGKQIAEDRSGKIRSETENYRLNHSGRAPQQTIPTGSTDFSKAFVVFGLITMLVLMFLVVAPAQAQYFEPGEGGYLHDAMYAFTMGHYYYVQEDYETALGYFEEAIEVTPQILFEEATDLANLYRLLGMTQAKLGLINEAVASNNLYLAYADEALVDEDIVVWVAEFEQ